MSKIFAAIAAILFFLSAVGAHIIPKAMEWGFVALAISLAVGGWNWVPWKKAA